MGGSDNTGVAAAAGRWTGTDYMDADWHEANKEGSNKGMRRRRACGEQQLQLLRLIQPLLRDVGRVEGRGDDDLRILQVLFELCSQSSKESSYRPLLVRTQGLQNRNGSTAPTPISAFSRCLSNSVTATMSHYNIAEVV